MLPPAFAGPPSSAELRDPSRWSGRRYVEPDPGADGHNVATAAVWSSCGRASAVRSHRSTPQGRGEVRSRSAGAASADRSAAPGRMPAHIANRMATNGTAVNSLALPGFWRTTADPRSIGVANLTSFNVGRIEPHNNQRDVVAGSALIGPSKQLLRGRLSRGLGVESSRNCFVGHHLG